MENSLLRAGLRKSETEISHCVRAVYIPMSDGSVRLARIQAFDRPFFREGDYELQESEEDFFDKIAPQKRSKEATDPEDIKRNIRRAKKTAFDYILCNSDLDTFCTLTFAPDSVDDRTEYADVYDKLRPWLSNRVQRRGLKYILVPERHKKGGIHLHMIANSAALSLENAYTPGGRKLTHNGKPLYNIGDWRAGFTSAEKIDTGCTDRQKVAKYIFKYMGKQTGQRIGGRYFLAGGDLKKPLVAYGDSPEELFDGSMCRYTTECEPVKGVHYTEWSYI